MKDYKQFLDKIFKLRKDSQKYYTYGYQEEYKKKANYDYGYIPFITGLEFNEIESIIPLTNPNNRCGDIKNSTEYIVVHDTASGAPSADALAHKKWLDSMANNPESTYCVSWHFTVDDHNIIQHLPLDEVGYHAGDGTKVPLIYNKTDIKYDEKQTIFTIDNDGYVFINGIKTNYLTPLTDEQKVIKSEELPTQGINYKVDEDGNYCLGNMYWNSGYKTLSNRGGNLNSVGIETCVNYGGDYTKTMRINAYLVAKLLLHYNLEIKDVKQHNSFSGKDCPMTMRHNNRWDEFIGLVDVYCDYFKNYKDIEFRFVSLCEEYLDKSGKIIKNAEGKTISYKVLVEDKEYSYSFIPGKLNFKENED